MMHLRARRIHRTCHAAVFRASAIDDGIKSLDYTAYQHGVLPTFSTKPDPAEAFDKAMKRFMMVSS